MFSSSPPEVLSKKDAVQIRSKPTGESRFTTLLKSHPRTDAPPRIQSTPAEYLSPGEPLWKTAPVYQKNFKRHKL